MSTGNMYVVQHSFTTGEISPEIENRSDLDKYRSAVLMSLREHLQAEWNKVYWRNKVSESQSKTHTVCIS